MADGLGEEFGDVVVVKLVDDAASGALAGDRAEVSQQAQLVRDGRCFHADGVGQLPAAPVGDGPYDVVIGDLLFSQLLHPALANAELPAELIDEVLMGEGPALTDAVLARLFAAAAPGGHVVCVHDVLG